MPINELKKLGDHFSALVVASMERMEAAAYDAIGYFANKNMPGIFMCLNKPYKSVKEVLNKRGIDTDKIFFIDCLTTSLGGKKEGDNVLHVQSPSDLTGLNMAVSDFFKKIPGKKFLIIDALTTFLIYVRQEELVNFIRGILKQSIESNVSTVILTPEPKGSDMLNNVSLDFDRIIKL